MAELEQQVGLDIQSALDDADRLAESAGAALDTALTAAIEGLSAQFVSVSDEIQSRLADLFSTEPVIPIAADTTPAEGELASLASQVDATHTEIEVDADTSGAEEALAGLADTADEASTSISSAAGGTGHLADSAGLLAGGAALARGEVGGLSEAAGALGGVSAAGVAGVAGLGASVGFLFEKGLDATAMLQRFDLVVGDMAEQVLNVKVGTLNEDLDKLAIKLGTDDEALRNASASVFQFALNSGASRKEAATFTNQVDALAARAIALNPALGSVSSAAESLEVRLSRGGRFAAAYGLSLTAAEINTRALSNTQKAAATDLTIYEKSQAAAQIAVERYGNTLNDTVAKGSKNAALEQRSLKEQLDNVFEAAGKPLVSPVLNLFRDSIPSIGALSASVGQLAQASLPLLKGGLEAAVPLLQGAATAVEGLTSVTDALGVSSVAAGAALGFAIGGPAGAAVGFFGGLVSTLAAGNDEQAQWAALTRESALATSELAKEVSGLDASASDVADTFERHVTASLRRASQAAEDYNDVNVFGLTVAKSRANDERDYESILTRTTVRYQEFVNLAQHDIVAAQVVINALKAKGENTTAFERALAKVAGTQKEATAAEKAAEIQTKALTGSYEDQIKILDEVNDALLAKYDKQFAAIHADENAKDAIDRLNSSYAEAIKAGKSVAEATEEQQRALILAEEAALRDAKAAADLAEQNYTGSDAAEAHRLATQAQVDKLHDLQGTLDPNSALYKFITGYILHLGEVQPSVATTATFDASAASAGVDAYIVKLSSLIQAGVAAREAGATVAFDFEYQAAAGMLVPARPGGTRVNVGEAGSDEVILPTDDRPRAEELLRAAGLGDLLGQPGVQAYTPPQVRAASVASITGQPQWDSSGFTHNGDIIVESRADADPVRVGFAIGDAQREFMFLAGR